MESIINTLFGEGLFTNIYFVEGNPATVKTTEIRKVDSEIQKVESETTFLLEKQRLEREGLTTLNVRSHLKGKFFELLDANAEKKEIRYFDRGFLKNLFVPKNPKEILECASLGDWVITSDDIVAEMAKASEIKHMLCYADVRLVGKIENTLVYKSNQLKNEIYIGKFDTVTPVFNRNILKEQGDQYIEYSLNLNSAPIKITLL